VFILLFTPLVIWFWKRQEARNREPSAISKMALGYLILSISYLILAAAQWAAGTSLVHWSWAIVFFAVYTLGELYFSPVGLSLYAKAAPPQVAALMMAVFLATSFPGNFLAGWLGKFYSTLPTTHFFLMIAIIAAVPVPIFWILGWPLAKIQKARENESSPLPNARYITPVE
jgi:POT family proton-dependent oligopeptide transporter